MSASSNHYDVVIIGAGLAGCATARALRDADPSGRRRIALIDKCTDVHPQFSGEFIHPRGAEILDKLGFYEPLVEAGAVDVDGFLVFEHADAQPIELEYGAVPNRRPRGLSVHHKTLVRTMRAQLRGVEGIDMREGWSLVDLVQDDGNVSGVVLLDPEKKRHTLTCDLVVAADGKNSSVRKLAGISDAGRETIGFTAGVSVTNATLARDTYAHVMLGAWGPVLAYPIQNEKDGTVTTRVTIDLPKELPAKGPALKDHVIDAFVPFLPAPLAAEVAEAVRKHPGNLYMAPTVNLPAPTALRRGVVLAGDAGGCSHPVTASGMTMGLRDAETLGEEAARRAAVSTDEPWFDAASLRRYRAEHDRYVPTRQALADAIYEAFRGEYEGSRAIRRALFEYWGSGPSARSRSMALLSCSESRPSVFLTEYIKTARHALSSSLVPQHARRLPVMDRVRRARGAAALAKDKLGLVAAVMWAQVRPEWMPHAPR
jgi:2-polyprenyl-6-methoxyphenol hydroxylase-like FAD-dependent oxidoreductase